MMSIGWASQLMFSLIIAASTSSTGLLFSEPYEYQHPQTPEEVEEERVLRARCEANPHDFQSEALLFYLLFKKVNLDHLEPHDEHDEHHGGTE